MIGIKEIGIHLPEKRVSNAETYPHYEADFFEKTVGVKEVARISPDERPMDLCLKALANLKQKDQNFKIEEVELIVVVTQPSGPVIPPISTEIHGAGDFPESTICFDLSIGCTGFVQGLSIVTSYMQQLGLKKALLFNVETISLTLDKKDENLNMLFGDAATVTYLGEEAKYRAIDYNFTTQGKQGKRLRYVAEGTAMNGLGVYDFIIRTAPKAILELMDKHNLKLDDFDCFAFHQASKRSISSLIRTLGVPKDRVPFEIMNYGNTGSCSIPLILEKAIHQKHKRIFIGGFGAGMALANGILISTEEV